MPALAKEQQSETVKLSHGRFERREHTVLGDLRALCKSWKWAGLTAVLRVRRTTHRGGSRDALSEEVHYHLSSLPPGAEGLAALVRHHWSVENKCHWVMDVTFNEDHCQVHERTAAHNLYILREMTAKLLRDHPKKASLRAKRKLAALDPVFRLALLASIPQPTHA
jgi:predicted transposase YbfD/YdcC